MSGIVPGIATRASLERATAEYEAQLPGSAAEEYLSKRAIDPTNPVVASFRLGYVANPISGDEWFAGRLAIPYLTPAGVAMMKFRSLDPAAEKKYLFREGDKARPFNVLALQTDGTVYITEGELDAVSATLAGLPAVGFPGAKHWQKVYSRLFRFRKVVVLADGDTAGWEFAESVTKDIENAKAIQMPSGEDVNSVLQLKGIDGLRELVGA